MLKLLTDYLSGEFDNKEQALAEPVWYVHLRLWHRPIPLFQEDSLTLFAEQANITNLEKPYRQRIMRLMEVNNPDAPLQVQYYMPKNPTALSGGGCNPALLNGLTTDQIDLLPGCTLNIKVDKLADHNYRFVASPPPDARCCFTYLGKTVEVALSFEVTQDEFISYDKGIDPSTGKATWGAILGPFRYTKRENLGVKS